MTRKLITRELARQQNLERFYTGKPCRVSKHIAERRVSDGRCIECRAATNHKSYVADPDKFKHRANAHYLANHEAQLQYRRDYHARKQLELDYRAGRQQYMQANRDEILTQQRARNATPEMKARKAALRKENAHKYRGYEQKRRARLQHAIPPWSGELDEFAMTEAAELCVLRQRATGIEWQMDHMIPILARRATGLHCAANIQVIPAAMNRSKNNRMILTEPLEWLAALC